MAFRIANGFMLALFLFSVVVQYNDPDPVRWMAIYGAAALVCGLAFTNRLKWPLPAVVLLIALTWAVWWTPRWWGKTTMHDTFAHMEMVDERAEEARETLGLLIVAAWMAVVAVRTRRAGRA